jgi:hypothetical protein
MNNVCHDLLLYFFVINLLVVVDHFGKEDTDPRNRCGTKYCFADCFPSSKDSKIISQQLLHRGCKINAEYHVCPSFSQVAAATWSPDRRLEWRKSPAYSKNLLTCSIMIDPPARAFYIYRVIILNGGLPHLLTIKK